MTRRAYGPKKGFKEETLILIRQANAIIEQYEKAGYSMSLRQLYYQLVAKNLIDNSDQSYDRLGRVISDARMGGLISWTSIEDRLRPLYGQRYHDSPLHALEDARASYRLDKWAAQPCRVETMVEKDAASEVVGNICSKLGVNYMVLRGYASMSALWRAGNRYRGYIAKGQRPIILHIGDHDPSGHDMSRDNEERINLFTGVPVTFVRIGLNMDQITELKLPPNPAKETDSRYVEYVRQYGEFSYELDALPPDYLHRLIETNVLRFRDPKLWDESLAEEAEDHRILDQVIEDLSSTGA